MFRLTCVAWVASLASLFAQDPPKVVSLSPEHLDSGVDHKTTTKLVATFDRAMSPTGWSFCGGGPKYPKAKGRPTWKDEKTIELVVELEPDHDYELMLNCPAASNFRSAKGEPLPPTPWSFTTLPATLPKPAEQRKRNQDALTKLLKTLAERYSYYDLRVTDWKKLEKEWTPALLAAKTDKAWASVAARMLRPTQDIHLHVRAGEQMFPTGTRAIDPLFRLKLLDAHLKVQRTKTDALYGRTEDGIGYLLIGTWGSDLDVPAVEHVLTELADTKALVVDVRPNSGGDETLAQRIAAWFVDGTKVYGKNRYRTGAGKNAFGPILERSVTGNKEPERRYDRPIAVLTSRYVMSSNESFVLMLRQAKDCTVVGQPTFGSSGNPKPFDLGNGVTLVIPSWQDLRPDGTCFEGKGLDPDVLVPATSTDLESHDPILEKALELLRKKVGTK
jgi:hypothetical protein